MSLATPITSSSSGADPVEVNRERRAAGAAVDRGQLPIPGRIRVRDPLR
jgi:hypothetical protein